MTPLTALSFAVAMLVLAASPGPGVFATVGRALASGLRPALLLVCGIILGDLIFLLLTIFGLALLAQTLGELFLLVKLFGGGYLIWQGIKLLRSEQKTASAPTCGAPGRNLIGGLLLTLGNPKVILFYGGFLPTFIDLQRVAGADILLLCAIVAAVLAGVLGSYAWLASSARQLLDNPRRERLVKRAAAGTLIGTGLAIAGRS